MTAATVAVGALGSTPRFLGRVHARKDVRLSFGEGGQIDELIVSEGERVLPGTVLARLALDRQLARVRLARYDQSADRSVAAFKVQEAAGAVGAGDALPRAERELLAAERDVTQARARAAGAKVTEARAALAAHRIVAPFAGVVVEVMASAGQWVPAGVPVLRVLEPDDLELHVPVPHARWEHVSVGDEVSIDCDTEGGIGRIEAKVPAARPDSPARLVVVRPSEPLACLVPGAHAGVTFRPNTVPGAVSIPIASLVQEGDATFVYRLEEPAEVVTAKRVNVRIGTGDGERILVVAALSPGDRVVERGAPAVRDGAAVTVTHARP